MQYTPELFETICERIEAGEPVREICKDVDMPAQCLVYRWVERYPEARERYTRARQVQAHVLAEQTLEVARRSHGGDVQAARLEWDALRWYAGKIHPKKYADKTINTEPDGETAAPPVILVPATAESVDQWLIQAKTAP